MLFLYTFVTLLCQVLARAVITSIEKMKKIIVGLFIVIPVVLISGTAYLKFALPSVGYPPDINIEITPERVERGKYLAYHVAMCMDCHSTRDWSLFSGPMVPGTDGKGGEHFGPEADFPGDFYSRNITSSHLGSWSDGEVFRAITSGVSRDGSALFPVMPYDYFRKMDREDIYDIIAFIRTLPPIENKIPARSVNFPLNLIINTLPAKPAFTKKPARQDTVAYGAYLANAAGCIGCHTPIKGGNPVESMKFAGGRKFIFPEFTVVSANITPDKETGIGSWTDSFFVSRFKAFTLPGSTPPVTATTPTTVMPWTMYGGMDTSDLISIFRYLQTQAPTKHEVNRFLFKN